MRNMEEIMTSVLSDPSKAKANAVVETASGSLYRLRNPDPSYLRKTNTSRGAAATAAPAVKKTPFFSSPSNKVPSLRIPSLQVPGVSPSLTVPQEEVSAPAADNCRRWRGNASGWPGPPLPAMHCHGEGGIPGPVGKSQQGRGHLCSDAGASHAATE